jgi:hypothetical protein
MVPGPSNFEDERSRDIFPLPLLHTLCQDHRSVRGLSRDVARRVLRRSAVAERANMAIGALNSLYAGGKCEAVCLEAVHDIGTLPLLQRDALSRILRSVKTAGPPPAGTCSSGALQVLRVASSSYTEVEPGVGDTVAMNLHSLSLPDGHCQAVDLGGLLRGDVGRMA